MKDWRLTYMSNIPIAPPSVSHASQASMDKRQPDHQTGAPYPRACSRTEPRFAHGRWVGIILVVKCRKCIFARNNLGLSRRSLALIRKKLKKCVLVLRSIVLWDILIGHGGNMVWGDMPPHLSPHRFPHQMMTSRLPLWKLQVKKDFMPYTVSVYGVSRSATCVHLVRATGVHHITSHMTIITSSRRKPWFARGAARGRWVGIIFFYKDKIRWTPMSL